MRARAVLSFVFVATIALAGNPTAGGVNKNKGVFRVESRLIEIDVVAQDSRGRAIKDLTRDDFKIYDNGKEVPIGLFSALSLTPTPAAPLPPKTFSNRIQGAPPNVTAVLLDGLNTSFHDQTWARKEVIRFLEELQPRDRAAIFLLGDHLYTLQNFTSDPKLLLAALRNAKATNPKEIAASAPPVALGTIDAAADNVTNSTPEAVLQQAQQQLNASLPQAPSTAGGASSSPGGSSGAAGTGSSVGAAAEAVAMAQMQLTMTQFQQHESAFFGVDRVDRTMDALMAIANYLAQFPGRKNLIWVSGSFPISIGFDTPRQPGDTRDQLHFTPELQRAYKALNNANLAVYPVDARGLVAAAPGEMDVNAFYSSVGTMQDLASHTGGQTFYNTNDLARVMRAAVDDSDANYTLGFYPQNIRWDGKYHTLIVKADKPGIHLRYRRGYFAIEETPKNEDQGNAALNAAIYSPLDSTGLGLTVSILNFVHAPKGPVLQGVKTDARNMTLQHRPVQPGVLLGIDIDARNVRLQDDAGSKSVDLAVVLAQLNGQGTVLHTGGYDMNLRVAEGGVSSLMREGLMVKKWVDLVDGAETLELVVRDPASGNIGSVRIPLEN
jgi:VWFA-related protein